MDQVQEETNAVGHKQAQEDDHSVEKANIEVYFRLRPMNKLELSRRSKHCVEILSSDSRENARVTIDSPLDGTFNFDFDRVFDEFEIGRRVYDEVASPLAKKLLKGFNTSLILYGQSGSGKTTSLAGSRAFNFDQNSNQYNKKDDSKIEDDEEGIMGMFICDIFKLMHDSGQEIEFTVRVSFIEIYLESINDLLSESNRFLKIKTRFGNQDTHRSGDTIDEIEGLTEVCCLRASDVMALYNRGQASQLIRERRNQTVAAKSNKVFTIKIEQKNIITKTKIASKMIVVDTSGSENNTNGDSIRSGEGPSRQLEKALLNRSHSALDRVVTLLGNSNPDVTRLGSESACHQSKLTSILMNSMGANCFTTFLLTASPASFNINATLATAKFGERLSRVTNFPIINIEPSPEESQKELTRSKKAQAELLALVKRAKSEAQMNKDTSELLKSAAWKKLSDLCERNESSLTEGQKRDESYAVLDTNEELRRAHEKIEVLQNTLSEMVSSRDTAQTMADKVGKDFLVLRNESQQTLQAKKKNGSLLSEAQEEIHNLKQRQSGLVHNLRTSRFRENEAVVFLRHFRRFYRRLLESNHAQGSGDLSSILSFHMSAAPDLEDLVDIDKLLMESGLLEDKEVGMDNEVGNYTPSKESLIRSSSKSSSRKSQTISELNKLRSAVNRMTDGSGSNLTHDETTLSTLTDSDEIVKIDDIEINATLKPLPGLQVPNEPVPAVSPENYSTIFSSRRIESGVQNGVELQQVLHQSPAGQLTQKRFDELEGEVILLTKRCIELQSSLNDADRKLDALTVKKRIAKRLKNVEHDISLRNELDRKGADLQAVIWKMNELHLINRTYNDKLSNREQHIAYLEDSMLQLQEKNFRLVTVHLENEKKMRGEVQKMDTIVDSLNARLWQQDPDDERNPLESRIILPFQAAMGVDVTMTNNVIGNVQEKPIIDVVAEAMKKVTVQLDTNSHKEVKSKTVFTSRATSGKTIPVPAPIPAPVRVKAKDGNRPWGRHANKSFCGGKDGDYIPIRFTGKRGRLIKAATLKGREERNLILNSNENKKGNGTIGGTVRKHINENGNVDVKRIHLQLNKLDALTKSWENRRNISAR